jgi:threonine dehydrogenase-like Zn-dependent dehydrogenase
MVNFSRRFRTPAFFTFRHEINSGYNLTIRQVYKYIRGWNETVLQNMKSGITEVVDVPVPHVRKGTVLVRTAASLVSAGTERNLVSFAEKNLVAKAQSRPDLVKQVMEKAKREGLLTTYETAMNRLDQPMALGYSSAGVVVEAAADVADFKPGDRVVCAGGGHAVHAEYALVPGTHRSFAR